MRYYPPYKLAFLYLLIDNVYQSCDWPSFFKFNNDPALYASPQVAWL